VCDIDIVYYDFVADAILVEEGGCIGSVLVLIEVKTKDLVG